MEISLEDAYNEACRALGESLVRERILTRLLNEAQGNQAAPASEATQGGE